MPASRLIRVDQVEAFIAALEAYAKRDTSAVDRRVGEGLLARARHALGRKEPLKIYNAGEISVAADVLPVPSAEQSK